MGGGSEQQEILQTLERIVGASGLSPAETTEFFSSERLQGAIAPGATLTAIISPATAEELADVVTTAHHHGWRLLPCGRGSKLNWGGLVGRESGNKNQELGTRDREQAIQNPKSKIQNPPLPLILLSTHRLNRLIEHAVGDLTITVEAGMKFADLQEILAKEGQFLAIDPTYPETATIGGIIATADTGSLRQRYQSVRDMLLGISFVRADGESAKAGGRVVKNVAGYDLMKLFTGSYGTLGILTQATFRVYPLPETSQTIVLSGGTEAAIAQATTTLLSSALTPASADLLSTAVVRELELGTGIGLAVRFQSIAASVKEQVCRMQEVGQSLGLSSTTFTETEDKLLWERLRERMTIAPQPTTITCKIGIRPSEAAALFRQLDQLFGSSGFCQIHAGSGVGRLLLTEPVLPDTLMKIRSCCQTNDGFLTILQAPVEFKQAIEVWGYAGNALKVMQKLKQQFDPQNLLNPGRFITSI